MHDKNTLEKAVDSYATTPQGSKEDIWMNQ
jgi:hypothetical protein